MIRLEGNRINIWKKAQKLIENNSKTLLHLINQLLDLSKLEDKSFQLNLQNGDIVPYIRYLTESFQTYANSKNIALRFFSSLEELRMDFDPEQIKKIMINLISNALKFTQSGGEVQVGLRQSQENRIDISVKDSGIGIDKKHLSHIFDRFYQVNDTSTKHREGTGIGLAHTIELVRLMQGDINVDSEPKNGTEFLVHLPVNSSMTLESFDHTNSSFNVELISRYELPDLAHKTQDELSANPTKKPLVLIIEDNPDVVIFLRSCLESFYELDIALNGQIGVDKALESIPDIIISDVMMPEKNGFEVCSELKAEERTSHIPIILLTAKVDVESKLAGLRRGADTYLAKPFDKEELLIRLEKLIERQQRLKNYFAKTDQNNNQINAHTNDMKELILIEDVFMQKVRKIVSENYKNESFGLPQLCQKIGMSRSQLFRKMKALIDTSPSKFIRSYRLNEAKLLLETTHLNVSEVAWEVGFKDISHFSKSFQDEFGLPPSATHK